MSPKKENATGIYSCLKTLQRIISCSLNSVLIDLIEDISTAMENKEYTIWVFLDLKKAFDTIDHDLLLQKLEFYVVLGISHQWVKSYLENRKQYVYYNSVSSKCSNFLCGVPQGLVP